MRNLIFLVIAGIGLNAHAQKGAQNVTEKPLTIEQCRKSFTIYFINYTCRKKVEETECSGLESEKICINKMVKKCGLPYWQEILTDKERAANMTEQQKIDLIANREGILDLAECEYRIGQMLGENVPNPRQGPPKYQSDVEPEPAVEEVDSTQSGIR